MKREAVAFSLFLALMGAQITQSPIRVAPVLTNSLMIFSLVTLLWSLGASRKLALLILTTVLWSSATLFRIKMEVWQEPLTLGDLSRWRGVLSSATSSDSIRHWPDFSVGTAPILALGMAIAWIFIFPAQWVRERKSKTRARAGAASLLTLAVLFFGLWPSRDRQPSFELLLNHLAGKTVSKMSVDHIPRLCSEAGWPSCLLVTGLLGRGVPPLSESEKKLLDAPETVIPHRSPRQLPKKIVLYFLESFLDLSATPIHWKKSPFSALERDSGGHLKKGRAYSAVYGGQSLHSHFEALTGISMALLPLGTVPSFDLAGLEIPSVAWDLGSRGYRTTFLAASDPYLWNAEESYRNLGFQNRVFRADYSSPQFFGRWLSDSTVVDEAIKRLAQTEVKDQPQFIAIAAEGSHGPWRIPAGADPRAFVSDFGTEPKVLDQLNAYAYAVDHALGALRKLMDALEHEPGGAWIIAVSDHLPQMSAVYAQMGWLDQNGEIDPRRRQEVPIWTWSSPSAPQLDLPDVSIACALPLVFDAAEAGGFSAHFRAAAQFCKRYPVWTRDLFRAAGSANPIVRTAAGRSSVGTLSPEDERLLGIMKAESLRALDEGRRKTP